MGVTSRQNEIIVSYGIFEVDISELKKAAHEAYRNGSGGIKITGGSGVKYSGSDAYINELRTIDSCAVPDIIAVDSSDVLCLVLDWIEAAAAANENEKKVHTVELKDVILTGQSAVRLILGAMRGTLKLAGDYRPDHLLSQAGIMFSDACSRLGKAMVYQTESCMNESKTYVAHDRIAAGEREYALYEAACMWRLTSGIDEKIIFNNRRFEEIYKGIEMCAGSHNVISDGDIHTMKSIVKLAQDSSSKDNISESFNNHYDCVAWTFVTGLKELYGRDMAYIGSLEAEILGSRAVIKVYRLFWRDMNKASRDELYAASVDTSNIDAKAVKEYASKLEKSGDSQRAAVILKSLLSERKTGVFTMLHVLADALNGEA